MLAIIRYRIFVVKFTSKSVKIKVYKTIIWHVVLCGCETWLLTLRKEPRLRVLENKVLRRIFLPKRDDEQGNGEDYRTRSFMICTPQQILFE